MTYRVGQGIDVHRFHAGRPLRLCGVEISEGPGLEGHSDADVALHALTDAVLGAVGAGDLGEHFPVGDPLWRDAESGRLLAHALKLASDRGFAPVNCDLTIVGERPRLARHRQAMRRSVAELIGLALEEVSVKATTSEGMGWIGRGEGLAALAVVLMKRRKSG